MGHWYGKGQSEGSKYGYLEWLEFIGVCVDVGEGLALGF